MIALFAPSPPLHVAQFRLPARRLTSSSSSCCTRSSFDSQYPLISDVEAQKHFLKTHWNRQPLFLPNLFPSILSRVTGDDLAALSEELHHHARIIQYYPTTSNPTLYLMGHLKKKCGAELPEEQQESPIWTLLLQNIYILLQESPIQIYIFCYKRVQFYYAPTTLYRA